MGLSDRCTFAKDLGGSRAVAHGTTPFAADIGGNARRRRAGVESGWRDRGAVSGWADQRRWDQREMRTENWRRRHPSRLSRRIGEVLLGRWDYSRSERGRGVVVRDGGRRDLHPSKLRTGACRDGG